MGTDNIISHGGKPALFPLELDLCAELNDLVGGQTEIARRRAGISRQEREKPLPPARHLRIPRGENRYSAQKVGRFVLIERKAVIPGQLQNLRHGGSLHIPIVGHHAVKSLSQKFHSYPIFGRDDGNIGRKNGEEDHLLMQEFVVLEVVQENRGGSFGG